MKNYLIKIQSVSYTHLVASLEGDTEKAADYSNRAITDMADNANKMGTNIQDIPVSYTHLDVYKRQALYIHKEVKYR